MKRRILSLFLVIAMLCTIVPAVSAASSFVDVSQSAWYAEAVDYAVENGLMNGVGNGKFDPNGSMTRAMLVTVLWRYEGSPAEGANTFNDVPNGQWYTGAVAWAAENGIVGGVGGGKFDPNGNVTREQMAAILFRYAGQKGIDTSNRSPLNFPDASKVSSWATDAIAWTVAAGIIGGSDGKLLPQGNATRAEVSTILMRFIEGVQPETPYDTQGHTYEFIRGMYSWEEGQRIAAEKGGYLVRFDSADEFKYVVNEITQKGYRDTNFIIGARRADGSRDYYFVDADDKAVGEKLNAASSWTSAYWASGEPTYEWEGDQEWILAVEYKNGKWGLNDIPDNATYPADPNAHGFIIEIENHTSTTCMVTFESNSGAEVPPQQVDKGGYATQPTVGSRDGYQFVGWFSNKDETDWKNTFEFSSTPIQSNLTLYAIWVDIVTDSDGDGLSDELELYRGTNIHAVDSDGDKLTDYEEVVKTGTDPLLLDTDNDGISDYDADEDADKLSNGAEISIGTSPIHEDSDFDGLSDCDEVKTLGTNPTTQDTDSDGATDSWEIEHGFDPCSFDDSFLISLPAQTPTKDTPVTAGVDAEVDGAATRSITIEPVNPSSNPLMSGTIPGYLGSAYDFSTEGELDEAVLHFYYDDSVGKVGTDFQPRIYYFDEASGELVELENQTVTDGKVSAAVSHFSTYILLNKIEFEKVWEREIKPPIVDEQGNSSGIDVVFVIDVSDSMNSYGRLSTAKTALNTFLDALCDKDRAALVKFNSSATTLSGLTPDIESVRSFVSSLKADGQTAMYKGFSNAIDLLTDASITYAYKMIVILSDGKDVPSTTYSSKYESLVQCANENNIVVYTVGAGTSVDTSILSKIAKNTGGAYYAATESSGITEAFEEIQAETVDLTTDTNGDKIPDYFNDMIYEGTLVLSNGSAEYQGIDFNYDSKGNPSDDWDGDGLKNGEELIVTYDENTHRVYMKMASDPMLVHSDGDGISDYDERCNGTDPMKAQLDAAKVNWLTDDSNYYYEDYAAEYFNNLVYQTSEAFLTVVYGIWNTEEIYRDIIAHYFIQYANSAEESLEKEKRATFVDIASNLVAIASKLNDKAGVVSYVKGLIDKANGYTTSIKTISFEYFKYVESITEYYPEANLVVTSTYSMSSTSVNILIEHSPLKPDKISKLSIVLDIASGAIDMADTIDTIAKINANSKVFDKNMDFLVELRDNGFSINIRNAAAKIIKILGEGFGSAVCSAMEVHHDAGETMLNMLMTVAATNPYVKAVLFLRDVIEVTTGIKEILLVEYRMLAYHGLSYAAGRLIQRDSYYDNGYYYDTADSLERYLTHLAQLRILGDKEFAVFASTGANKWVSDEEKIQELVAISIKNIKNCAAALGLKLSPKLN